MKLYTVNIYFDSGMVTYYAEDEPDICAIKECLLYFWLLKTGRVKQNG